MNIFMIDTDHAELAMHLTDRHLSTHINVCAQILGAAHVRHDTAPVAVEHVPSLILPSASANNRAWLLWGISNRATYVWTYSLLGACLDEYRLRVGHEHKFGAGDPSGVLDSQLATYPDKLPAGTLPPLPVDVPVEYMRFDTAGLPDALESYRQYYESELRLMTHTVWTDPGCQPAWLGRRKVS